MRCQKAYPLQNFFNHGQINLLESLLKYIPPFSKRSCISIVQFASSQFSSIAPKKSSSSMPASFAARRTPLSPALIFTPCMSISISGVALSIASGFLLLSHLSAASGGCGKRNDYYAYIAVIYELWYIEVSH
jgi:hypothetical protein